MTIIPIATLTLALPNTVPTTVGIVAKNPPFAAPLIITKATNGPKEFETGHITNILAALSKRETNKVFNGPNLSAARPHISLPTADEKLKPATRPAPALDVRPNELL